MTTEFDLGALLAGRGAERYELHAKYLNPQLPRMLHTIGFDKVYERAEGAHFYDADGNDYLDMLAGFGVMGLGRHHPVVRKALHDVLDLNHGSRRDRPEVRPVRHRQAARPLLRPRLPRPDHRFPVGQRRGRLPRRLRPAAARHRRAPR